MTNHTKTEDSKNLPKHIFLVFNKCLLYFTPLNKLELQLFKITELLINKGISNLTVFNLDGCLNHYFYNKYAKCSNKNFECPNFNLLSYFNNSYLDDSDKLSDSNHTLMYFINRINSKLFISTYNSETHSKSKGLLLVLIDRTHSHIKLLNTKNTLHTAKLNGTDSNYVNHEDNWVREKTKKGLSLEYIVPNDSAISQPNLQKLVCAFDGLVTILPDLIISLRLCLKDLLLFLLSYSFRFSSRFHNKALRNRPSKFSKPNFRLLYSAFMVRLGNIFRAGMSIIHSFGPEGIQPWFLAEAEIYEYLGIDVADVSNCIKLFSNTVRRCGK